METRRKKRRGLDAEDGCQETGFRGLVNSGCTCYVNCVLQVLLHIPRVKDFCLDHETSCSEACLVCELAEVATQMLSTTRTPFAVTQLLECLRTTASEFSDGGMHDAHDFWLLTVDTFSRHPGGGKLVDGLLRGEMLTTLKCETCGYMSRVKESVMDLSLSLQSAPYTAQPNGDGSLMSDALVTAPMTVIQKEIPIGEIKSGSKKRLRRCGTCATCSNPRQKKGCLRNKGLNLAVSSSQHVIRLGAETMDTRESKRSKTLQQCIKESNEIEVVAHWNCDQCQQLRNAVKETTMIRLPDLLAVHLKRFEFDSQTRRSRKLNIHIDCPIILDTSVLCPRLPVEKWRYCLVAIVAHRGSLDGGHFWTYLRRHDRWFKLNDAAIDAVDVTEVMSAQAYMAFYEKLRHGDEGYPDRPNNQE